MEWLIAAVAIVLLWQMRRRRLARGDRYVRIEGDGNYALEIVGESKYQDALEAIAGEKTEDGHEYYCEALLKREPTNPYDRNAVAVLIGGNKVGYLSRPHAKKLASIFKSKRLDGGYAQAVIVGGWRRRRGDEGHYGVRLDIPID